MNRAIARNTRTQVFERQYHSEFVNLRDTFNRGKHQNIILLLTALRRHDRVLAVYDITRGKPASTPRSSPVTSTTKTRLDNPR